MKAMTLHMIGDNDIKEPKKEVKKVNTVGGKSNGVKRKHEVHTNKKKKENSKRTYKRRVDAYKRKTLEMKDNKDIPLPPVIT